MRVIVVVYRDGDRWHVASNGNAPLPDLPDDVDGRTCAGAVLSDQLQMRGLL